jgi:NAD(P)-dependent dehydrogenase (short-subunit alcohol dehydrogenase family)
MNLVLFGGTGGLGSKLGPLLQKKYNVISVGSKDVNLESENEVKHFFEATDCDILVNMSVINTDGFVHKIKTEDMDKQIEVNVKGTIRLLKHALPNMRLKKYGRIILFSSILATRTVMGTSLYSASKCFIDSLARTCALENANYGITCNSVRLGYFDGGLSYRITKDLLAKIIQEIPFKRLGKIEEICNCISFIIDTEYLTGSHLTISGGL